MKNKFSFLTLFSLILILGVYYITLPSDIFKNEKTQSVSSKVDINVSENNKLVALRVERDENASNVMAELQDKILSSSNSEEKSELFNELQRLNLSRGKETFLEDKIRDNLSITSLVEIKGELKKWLVVYLLFYVYIFIKITFSKIFCIVSN